MKPVASTANTARLGPHSRALRRGVVGDQIDGRSREGRFLRAAEAELIAHVGGEPSFGQRILIRRAARAMLRLELLDAKMADGSRRADVRRVVKQSSPLLARTGREDALARSNAEPSRHRCRTCSRRIAVSAEISILKAMADLRLFGSGFKDISTWRAWMAFLAALFGIALSDDQADTFRACTARSTIPNGPFAEAWLVCGRRSGKSFIMALIAVFLACFRDYRPYLGPGEKATIMVIAADRRQARVVLRYVRGLLAAPVLGKLVVNDTAESIELAGNTIIEVGTASHSIRGYTIAAALCDEIAFWPKEDSAAPDMEILAALRPAMATIPRSMLIAASSPYSRSGALWDAYRRNYGADDPSILVWRAPTLVMNPSVPKRIIDEAFERDPASAAAEYNAEFRSDIDSFVSREAVEACVEVGLRERAPASTYATPRSLIRLAAAPTA